MNLLSRTHQNESHFSECWIHAPSRPLTVKGLQQQSLAFRGTGGTSEENSSQGFAPAFLDTATGRVHRARFADGRPAPMHLIEGLPQDLIASRDAAGRAIATVPNVIAGFVRQNQFYTREQAAAAAG